MNRQSNTKRYKYVSLYKNMLQQSRKCTDTATFNWGTQCLFTCLLLHFDRLPTNKFDDDDAGSSWCWLKEYSCVAAVLDDARDDADCTSSTYKLQHIWTVIELSRFFYSSSISFNRRVWGVIERFSAWSLPSFPSSVHSPYWLARC